MALPKKALDPKVARLIDANLNRLREGVRVVEDTARFVWNDGALYKRLRSLRHQAHRLTAGFYNDLLRARESESDAGRRIAEGKRASVSAVLSANLRRAQEAARVLEEYGKVLSPATGAGFKKIRYQLYVEENRLQKHL